MPDDLARRVTLAQRDAVFQPSTFDDRALTVELVWSTGAAVERVTWFGDRYIEELEISESAVDLARLNAGAPLLDTHGQMGLDDVIGVVDRAWIADGSGRAVVRFSPRAAVADVVRDVKAGIIRNVSVGYMVDEWLVTKDEATGRETRRATRWTPFELSLVPIPVDAAAQVRSARRRESVSPGAAAPTPAPAAPAATEEVRMTDVTPPAAPPPAAITPPAPAAASVADLRALVARSQGRLTDTWVVDQLAVSVTLDEARDKAIDAMATPASAPLNPTIAAQELRSEVETIRTRLADAFLASQLQQLAPHLPAANPVEHAREFMGLRFHGLIAELLTARGVRNVHRMKGSELFDALLTRTMHTASDFVFVLANSVNKSVRLMYEGYPATWRGWTSEVDVADFKTITAATLGMFPEPKALEEGAAIRYGSIAEDAETYAVLERACIVALSRVAIINDDTRALQDVISNAALGGYNALRRVVFGILTGNAAMRDGTALFHADHANLGAAANLSSTTFAELRALLSKQAAPARGLDVGETAPYLPPPLNMVLLVGPDEASSAQQLISPLIVPTAVSNAVPATWRAQTTVIEEGFLDVGNDPYYLARTDMMRAIEIAYLSGQNRSPQVVTAEQFDVSGASIKVMFDFGAKAVSYRGIAANLG